MQTACDLLLCPKERTRNRFLAGMLVAVMAEHYSITETAAYLSCEFVRVRPELGNNTGWHILPPISATSY